MSLGIIEFRDMAKFDLASLLLRRVCDETARPRLCGDTSTDELRIVSALIRLLSVVRVVTELGCVFIFLIIFIASFRGLCPDDHKMYECIDFTVHKTHDKHRI